VDGGWMDGLTEQVAEMKELVMGYAEMQQSLQDLITVLTQIKSREHVRQSDRRTHTPIHQLTDVAPTAPLASHAHTKERDASTGVARDTPC